MISDSLVEYVVSKKKMFMFGRLIDVRFFLVEENKKRESFDRCLYFNARDIGTLI